MMKITPSNKEVLLPDRHPQQELFLCDIADAIIKDDMASMEHPFFTLSKKPVHDIQTYKNKDKVLRVVPSHLGLATIYDKDILIFAISQLIAAINRGEAVSPYVQFKTYDFLVFANRTTGGRSYSNLKESLERLNGTNIYTNVDTEEDEEDRGFGIIEHYRLKRAKKDGRITAIEVKLSDWTFRAISAKQVLTLHPDYFRLSRPLERRIYEIARKHCGGQKSWKISVDNLRLKCGSKSVKRRFKQLISNIEKHNHLPDYRLHLEGDAVVFTNRSVIAQIGKSRLFATLDPETFNDARTILGNWDVYYIEEQWRMWMQEGGLDVPKHPDKAFLGFCRSWRERKGLAK